MARGPARHPSPRGSDFGRASPPRRARRVRTAPYGFGDSSNSSCNTIRAARPTGGADSALRVGRIGNRMLSWRCSTVGPRSSRGEHRRALASTRARTASCQRCGHPETSDAAISPNQSIVTRTSQVAYSTGVASRADSIRAADRATGPSASSIFRPRSRASGLAFNPKEAAILGTFGTLGGRLPSESLQLPPRRDLSASTPRGGV